MNILSRAVFTLFLRRFVFVSVVIMITANVHISTTSSKFFHVVSSHKNKLSAIFQTKTTDRPPGEAEKYSAGRKYQSENSTSVRFFAQNFHNLNTICDKLTVIKKYQLHIATDRIFIERKKEITCSYTNKNLK